jgi:uncharacterized protein (UPF0276 family)
VLTNKLKFYGLGIGLRDEIQKDILSYLEASSKQTLIQWLEIIPENYINNGGLPRKRFEEVLAKGVPLIPHGVNLSIGSAPQNKKRLEFDFYLLKGLKELFQEIKAPWFSDHLVNSRIGSHYFQELIPVPFTKEAADVVANNIKYLEDYFQIPFLFENPSYYTNYGLRELREQTFINLVLEKARCGFLLDINNVLVNSINHKYLPKPFLDDLDLRRVVQIHLGGLKRGYTSKLTGHSIKVLDSHSEPVSDVALDLFSYVIKKTKVKAVLLERDMNFSEEGFLGLIYELKQIRKIMDSKYDSEEENETEKTELAANQTESVINTEPVALETELNNNPSPSLMDKQIADLNINPTATPASTAVIHDLAKNQLANDLNSLDEELADLG